ncbi:hypothetical protein [Desulfosarcina cetonica]|uniref:hypothetical protein n=1 Tax=Desulfosarcina cetonica TaxID=90730 RepID=UPI0006D099C6|nr:hypothetical protein [Desulfosarcina cetonica]
MGIFLASIVFLLVLALIGGLQWVFNAIGRREKRQHLRVFLKSQAALPTTPAQSKAAAPSRPSDSRLLWGMVDLVRLETLLMAADVPISAQRMAILALLLGLAGFLPSWPWRTISSAPCWPWGRSSACPWRSCFTADAGGTKPWSGKCPMPWT